MIIPNFPKTSFIEIITILPIECYMGKYCLRMIILKINKGGCTPFIFNNDHLTTHM